ncbi:uncharacterized protein ALTATR162_LOCUS6108 [Alternaria atra]|jgi:hypothetical protein|uniref:Uncharacterized protein n=1 Tax=Alternaria atra TaxID=119953 RepID=A0A8J2I191_9PLEO|nr:uncharacterized protein ALTATR162_LOCUS6108 [Alternaria atra]CAG5161849.1 unnamed protein product [Alternaria atra]
MIKTFTMLLGQVSTFYLFIKVIISSFAIPTTNLSTLIDLVKNTTQPTSLLVDPSSVKDTEGNPTVAFALGATKTIAPSTRLHTQPKAHTISKRRTTMRKSRYDLFSKINEMPSSPGIQCATM